MATATNVLEKTKEAKEQSGVVKLSVNLAADLVEQLKAAADRRGVTMTETIRQALSNELWLRDQMEKGASVLIEYPGKAVQRVVFR